MSKSKLPLGKVTLGPERTKVILELMAKAQPATLTRHHQITR